MNQVDDRKSQKGFVLIAVLWIVAFLALTSATFVAHVRINTLLAQATVNSRKLQAAADGMTRLISLQVATGNETASKIPKNGQLTFCNWGDDIAIAYSIQDQGGLVDLNTTNPNLLKAVIHGLGYSDSKSDSIVAAITDFKDPDALTPTGVDERRSYPPKSAGPNNGPFLVVEELDRIPGIDGADFRKLEPLFTVYSQQPGFDPKVAPTFLNETLKSSGGMGTVLSTFYSPSPERTFAIQVSAQAKSHAQFTRDAIIAVTGQPDRPFAIVKWSKRDRIEGAIFERGLDVNCIH